VDRDIQQRCRDMLLGAVLKAAGQTSVMLDVKMVGVRDGLTLWHYRRLFSSLWQREQAQRVYFQSNRKLSQGKKGALAAGGSLLGSGLVFLIASPAVSAFAAPGVIGVLIGGGLLLLAQPGFQSPSEVLCVGSPVADPFGKSASSEKVDEKASAEARFEATLRGQLGGSEIVRQISRQAAAEFIELLVFIQQMAPKAPQVKLRPPAPVAAGRITGGKGRPTSGCELLASWAEQGLIKKELYRRNCKVGQ
jgi:hypothetical protein